MEPWRDSQYSVAHVPLQPTYEVTGLSGATGPDEGDAAASTVDQLIGGAPDQLAGLENSGGLGGDLRSGIWGGLRDRVGSGEAGKTEQSKVELHFE